MQNSFWVHLAIMLLGVSIGAVSQILLKKAAQQTYDTFWKQYLNARVIGAYSMFVLSTLCTVVALRVLPLSLMPVWNSAAYVLVTLFAYLIMKERPNRKKLVGLGVILLGIVLFSLPL